MKDNLKTEDEWKKKLTKEQYKVLREKETEKPFTGKLLYNKKKGKYICAACGNVIFNSSTKFDSNCGWPSFYDARKGSVKIKVDLSHGMIRREVLCAKCGSHLGHIFNDAPQTPTGKRFCINSIALNFKKDGNK
jgi:peptide-methionine (R)-S-oxide reductase